VNLVFNFLKQIIMKELSFEQMEELNGGIICAVVGATVGLIFTPLVGMGAGILCHMTYGAYDAY
jgi:hypothetical protein